MDFSLNEEQEAVRDLARQILAGTGPLPGGGRPDSWLDEASWRRLGDAGLLGIAVPTADGGGGYGMTELALLAEEAGRVAARLPIAGCLAGAARPVATFGSAQLRARLLPGVMAGNTVLTAAFTEGVARNPLQPQTAAIPHGDGWRFSGTKVAVPLARQAAAVLVPAVTPSGQVVVALVAPDQPGLTLVDEQTSSGEPACGLALDDVHIGAADVLAGEHALRFAWEGYLTALCGTELGLATEALRMAAAHTSTREQFGRPLATFQAVAVRLGNAFIDVQAIQSTLWQAAWRLDAGLPAAQEVASAAFWAAEAGERVLTSAVHLHGGLGVDTDYPLHHWFLASKMVELALGGASYQLDRLGLLLSDRA